MTKIGRNHCGSLEQTRQSNLACSASIAQGERKMGANKHSRFWNELVGISYFRNFGGGGSSKRERGAESNILMSF